MDPINFTELEQEKGFESMRQLLLNTGVSAPGYTNHDLKVKTRQRQDKILPPIIDFVVSVFNELQNESFNQTTTKANNFSTYLGPPVQILGRKYSIETDRYWEGPSDKPHKYHVFKFSYSESFKNSYFFLIFHVSPFSSYSL